MSAAPARSTHVSLAEALMKDPPLAGNLALPIFAHGSLEVELYSPNGVDTQQPHSRDEVYVVTRGSGVFFDGARRYAIEAGSFLFVAAGQPHRFESFSPDFAVWVFSMDLSAGNRLAEQILCSERFVLSSTTSIDLRTRTPCLGERMKARWQIIAVCVASLSACSDSTTPAPPTTGGMTVTIATTGSLPDPDGYTVAIDGATGVDIGVNGTYTKGELDPGDHLVALSGLAGNCTVVGDNPRTASVTVGDTIAVAIEVACPTPPCGVVLGAGAITHRDFQLLLTSDREKLAAGCSRRSTGSTYHVDT
jgi:hypothetical protein